MPGNPFKENPFKKLSKPQLYIAIAGATAIGGYFVIHHHSETGSWNPWSAATTSTTSGSGIDPVTDMPYSQDNVTDPVTGETYLAEAQQYGSVAAAEAAVESFGQSSPTGTGTSGITGTGETGTTNPVGTAYTSNAAWSQAAVAGLADVGYPETDVATALGDYLTSTPVNATQAGYIRTALSEYGDPPVGTFQIIMLPASGPGGGPMVTVPAVVGQDLVTAQRNLGDAGLTSTAEGPKTVKSGETRTVTEQSPNAQDKVAKGTDVKLTYKISNAPSAVDHGPVKR